MLLYTQFNAANKIKIDEISEWALRLHRYTYALDSKLIFLIFFVFIIHSDTNLATDYEDLQTRVIEL